uniref:Cardio-excitatory FMRFamide homolog NF1 n=1 Tax=Procambarus clarkii TaxID=6728 RepID=FAR1_PROCL|nr:RecName: Full=Cardio-excitatory FMRFamide homolog NF1 [Procambarus clarkii]AAB26417.1 DF2=cardioexcitatory FMRFamide homolog [Procambarus clarkii=crayfish, pericardial organs, Peptide, 7 aa] [Procambarus clarkii]
NRNFLRF